MTKKLAACFLLVTGYCLAAGNLILNGNFQADAGGFPLYWMFRSHSNGSVFHFPDGGPEGRSFIHIQTTDGAFCLEQRNLKVVPEAPYLLSAFFRTRNVKDNTTGIILEEGAGITSLPGDCPEWQQRSVQVSFKYENIMVRIIVDENGGELDIAGLQLLPLSGHAAAGARSQRENLEAALVPLFNQYYLSAPASSLKFYWAGVLPAAEDRIECVFTLQNSQKKIPAPLKDGEVLLDLSWLPPGEGQLTAILLDKETRQELYSQTYDFRILDIPKLPPSARILNNLVTEIYDGSILPDQEILIPNPRYGWLFFRCRNKTSEPFQILLDGEKILDENSLRGETVRLLEPGHYRIKSLGGKPQLTVRLIPDILNFPLGSSRWPGNSRYNWNFAKKHLLPGLTTVNVGGVTAEELQELKAMGLKWYSNFGVLNPEKKNDRQDLLERLGTSESYTDLQYDGMTLDETEYWSTQALDPYASALKNFPNPRKIPLHSYVIGPPSPSYANFISAMINAANGRGRILYENYNRGQRSEADAENYLRQLSLHASIYRAIIPDIMTANLSVILGNFSENPSISLANFPHVDYKYYLEMQVRMLATDPAFRGLGGVGWWGTHAANEEIVRWSFALMKHYAIEGNTSSLSEKYGFVYAPGHVSNPDFEEGLSGWQANDLVSTGSFPGFGKDSQKRYGSIYSPGDQFAILKRTQDQHAELKQTISKLIPGKIYSLTFFCADHKDLQNRIVAPRRHHLEYDLGNVDILKRICAVDTRTARDEKDNAARINAFRILFRAEKNTAELTFRNQTAWPGEELALNYISVMPRFEP